LSPDVELLTGVFDAEDDFTMDEELFEDSALEIG
jgi:hypothetical protein